MDPTSDAMQFRNLLPFKIHLQKCSTQEGGGGGGGGWGGSQGNARLQSAKITIVKSKFICVFVQPFANPVTCFFCFSEPRCQIWMYNQQHLDQPVSSSRAATSCQTAETAPCCDASAAVALSTRCAATVDGVLLLAHLAGLTPLPEAKGLPVDGCVLVDDHQQLVLPCNIGIHIPLYMSCTMNV